MIIGITGNSGTGKTTLAKELQKIYEEDIYIIDADRIAKELMVPVSEYYKKTLNLFGENILNTDGEIDRRKLANIIFNDSKAREELDKLTFKYVVDETKKIISKKLANNYIIDAPLLIESKLNELCDRVISIIADEDVKLDRICIRDNKEKNEAFLRINSQKDDIFYIKNSDYVVVNNDDLDVEKQAKDLLVYLNSYIKNENIVIIQDKDLKILQFKKLLEFENIKHAFTLKPLDFGSNAKYESIKDEVDNNYKQLCSFLGLDYNGLVRSKQTHTKNVEIIDTQNGMFPKELDDVDALVTEKENKILSLVFADCMPIFVIDKTKQIIANIHSGWQGTLQKISLETINKMIDVFKCNPKDIYIFIGPTIRKCHFEVDEDVKDKFVKEYKGICNEEEFVTKSSVERKYYIDTICLNKRILESVGLPKENIIDSNICTVCNSNLIHSYRAEKENALRCTSVICKI